MTEPIMRHLNSFLAQGRGDLNKIFPKAQMPGGNAEASICTWVSGCLPHTYCLYNWQDNISHLDQMNLELIVYCPENEKENAKII